MDVETGELTNRLRIDLLERIFRVYFALGVCMCCTDLDLARGFRFRCKLHVELDSPARNTLDSLVGTCLDINVGVPLYILILVGKHDFAILFPTFPVAKTNCMVV